MFIAWRSVTEAKNKIFISVLSIIYAQQNHIHSSSSGGGGGNRYTQSNGYMPCDIFQTTMKIKLMIVYILAFINANVLFFLLLCCILRLCAAAAAVAVASL